jgi:hypothetical protein
MTNQELLERAGAVEPINPDLLARTATMLAAQTTALEPTPTPTSVRRLQARRPRAARHGIRFRVLTPVAAAVGMVVVLVGTLPDTTSHEPSAGASELSRLALVADKQVAQSEPGPGQYQYTSSIEAYTSSVLDGPHPYTDLLPETRQIWIGSDGSGRISETYGVATFLSPQDYAAWVAAGSPDLAEPPSDSTFGPGQLSDGPTNLSNLPTDPKVLSGLISSRKIEGGPPGPAEDFTQVGDLLRETDAPPALRAALFEVAATIPGVEQLGSVTDHSGRTGVGVAYVSGGSRHELIFNPTDSSLMGEEDVVVDADEANEPAGTVTDWAVYLSSKVVDSDGAPPAQPSKTPSGQGVTPAPGVQVVG